MSNEGEAVTEHTVDPTDMIKEMLEQHPTPWRLHPTTIHIYIVDANGKDVLAVKPGANMACNAKNVCHIVNQYAVQQAAVKRLVIALKALLIQVKTCDNHDSQYDKARIEYAEAALDAVKEDTDDH